MKVTLIAHTPDPEQTVACAAKLCYSNSTIDDLQEGLTPEKSAAFLEMLAGLGHASPIEHASFTFGIEGVSRSLLAEITRHRIASFSVQSQRYVKENQFAFVTPPEIAACPEALEIFEDAMRQDTRQYNKLADILFDRHFKEMIESGMDDKTARRNAEKRAIEDARFVLPNACVTKMLVTMNARSLYNFFRLRCCNRAQWEIRTLAREMLRLVSGVAPTLFETAGPPCYAGDCPEGKMSCGKMSEMREIYRQLHKEASHG